jgi:hypothetical protein
LDKEKNRLSLVQREKKPWSALHMERMHKFTLGIMVIRVWAIEQALEGLLGTSHCKTIWRSI